ncbi:histidinol-phosphatase [Christiangramia sediminis]|uniref:Histidinol-phosphatase n=1 Tax=Christiangramia sediminis TaxID=2881336 RepID=A0A9X1LLM4_9FLAO|nr:histidinol-phosphatase [Christiangramia sediminis]MCB7482578.1 histidinol-phosphatase [Christiangramia sediminis]
MKTTLPIILLILFNFSSLHSQESQWYKGNLHTHSYWSDGDEFPEMIMQWYKDNDYQFVALSDHNIIAEGEKWKQISKDTLYQNAFKEYLAEYGEDWVNYKKDENRLKVQLKTLQEFRPLFEVPEEFMIFKAEEVTSYLDDKAVHMGAINIEKTIEPQKGNTIVELIQNNLDAIMAQEKEIGRPVMQHLNHPNFTYAITAEDIIQIDGERFFEVFNGHPYVNNYGDSIHDSSEQMWDQVNIAYHSMNKPLLLGIATDDSHHYHKFGSKFSNAGRGWVVVRAKKLDPTNIIEAMEAGDFYASTGVELSEVSFEENELSIAIEEEKDVNYEISFIGVKKNSSQSEVLKKVKGTKAKFQVTDEMLFVRAKIVSDKLKENPYSKGDTEVAWTQPVSKK